MPRRLIGIDLAWGERAGSGCAELAWRGDELELVRVDVLQPLDAVVEWIDAGRGAWLVAVDAPLVVLNRSGRRRADAEVSAHYRTFDAGALPANLSILGRDHRGGRLLRALEARGGALAESADDLHELQELQSRRLAFETFPHAAMVQLFALERTLKYKRGKAAERRSGQQALAAAIRTHLCAAPAAPRLQLNEPLETLLRTPAAALRGAALKRREDMLDALICAYAAAWADAGKPLQALGQAGAGVVIVPQRRGIGG